MGRPPPRSGPFAMPRTALLLIVALLSALVAAAPAGGQSEGSLRERIGSGKQRERTLASAAARLGQLERKVGREVAVLEGRLSAAQSELDRADARLASTQIRLDEARRRVHRLRKRLAEVRLKLSGLLRERYMTGSPGFMTVVLHADGFPQLLETLQFVRRVERSDTRLLDLVREARTDADRERTVLDALEQRRDREAAAARTRRDALASITQGLRDRQAFLARAHAARLAALGRARSGRRKAERELKSLLAARARAAVSNVGPGGPWAIPWAIVQCESGGQNLPPNYAGASGYYQFMVATWKGLGGSTPQAFQASKAEQDRLAARLWAGGAGRDNWVCASLVDG